ncbi:hypothetical protein BD309DRAFT_184563 [Dichomitus squalens]|nr:hypothetical protein BD309DRAFT_184563 [Dichomitus squalens]
MQPAGAELSKSPLNRDLLAINDIARIVLPGACQPKTSRCCPPSLPRRFSSAELSPPRVQSCVPDCVY